MKRNNVLLVIYLMILSSVFLSCSNSEDDSFSPYYYVLKIRILDNSGNDIVHGIDTRNNKPDNSIVEISESVYELDVTQSGKSEERLILAPLSVQITDPTDYLVITTSTLPLPDYRPLQLTHKLKCPYIFGDEEEHILISNWKETNPVGNACISLSVDGKTYSVVETDEEGYPILLVVLGE